MISSVHSTASRAGAAVLLLALASTPAAGASSPARAPSLHARPATRAAAPVAVKSDSARSAAPAVPRADAAGADDLTLKGGQEGTVFRSLTVEGEDRIHVDFDRPALDIDLDPAKAPGLQWGSARDVLDRTLPDFVGPLVTRSVRESSPYLARPWLSEFATGPVARFEPSLRGVERWTLTVVDARGQVVASFQGRGEPPTTIDWDGRSQGGAPVTPGVTYSYVFEAFDRAGNKRHFVGPGFSVPAYRLEGPNGPTLLFSGHELGAGASQPATSGFARAHTASPIVLEAASWINQSERTGTPLVVKATARTQEQAQGLARSVSEMLTPLVLGDPTRVMPVANVQPDAPEDGTVAIAPAR